MYDALILGCFPRFYAVVIPHLTIWFYNPRCEVVLATINDSPQRISLAEVSYLEIQSGINQNISVGQGQINQRWRVIYGDQFEHPATTHTP